MRATRAEFTKLLARLTPSMLIQPGVAGAWSVKDMLAHLAWYEREEAELIREAGVQASPLWAVPCEPRNALLWEQRHERPLEDVMADFREAFEMLVTAVEGLSDEDLVTPGRFPGTAVELPPWLDIAHNSFEHEQEHISMIRRWHESGAAPEANPV